MTLFWGRHGGMWEPEGGEHREWRDLQAGDLVVVGRTVWSVREVRLVPVADWDEDDRDACRRAGENSAPEDWPRRPAYLDAVPARGGTAKHFKVRPYATLAATAYVLHPHYPVCSQCGEPWPCPEIDITREARRQSAELDRLSQVMPGCCWACGGPVTDRQPSIVFEGENLLLPGAPPPVFHLRRKGGCRSAAMDYEDRWVPAGENRPWRLQCAGRLTRHVDGAECDQDGCPGTQAHHMATASHLLTGGGKILRWSKDCPRCAAAAEEAGCRWATDAEAKTALGW